MSTDEQTNDGLSRYVAQQVLQEMTRRTVDEAVNTYLYTTDLHHRIRDIAWEYLGPQLTDDRLSALVAAAVALPPPDAPDESDDESDDPNDVSVTIVFKSGTVVNIDVPPDMALQMSKHFKDVFKLNEPILGTYPVSNAIPIQVDWSSVVLLY